MDKGRKTYSIVKRDRLQLEVTMEQKTNPLETILHPYMFVLREGEQIKNNLLDYRLMIFQVSQGETIRSPRNPTQL